MITRLISVFLQTTAIKKALILGLVFVAISSAQESHKHKLFRRAMAIAACGASLADAIQTNHALGIPGIHELSPAGFSKTAFAFKATACAAPLIFGEIESRRNDPFLLNLWTWAPVPETAAFVGVIVHNHLEVNKQQAIDNPQPGQLK